MSSHVVATCSESGEQWLPLIEYSVKTGVSLSTLRRKIKSNSIPHKQEKGRYLILFNGKDTSMPAPGHFLDTSTKMSLEISEDIEDDMAGWKDQPLPRVSRPVLRSQPAQTAQANENSESFEKAILLLSDAFEMALDEKEGRIKQLEQDNKQLQDRLDELRLLVKVLEEKYQVRY